MDGASVPSWTPHRLHAAERDWPETNCYADLWIEALHARGLPPEPLFGFTAALDWEGDQFTFFKPPPGDLRLLFGVTVQELAIYDCLEVHAAEQVRRGRLVLAEVDSYWLPDTQATAYRREHAKTTIGIVSLDPSGQWLEYFHNAGRFRLAGEDYRGVLGSGVLEAGLPPYAELARFDHAPLSPAAMVTAAHGLLRRHLADRPRRNPVRAFAAELPPLFDRLAPLPTQSHHLFAFNTLRQLGAAFGLLAEHCDWLARRGEGPVAAVAPARDVSAMAKALQFQLARALRRGGVTALSPLLDQAAEAHDRTLDALVRHVG